MANVDAAFSGEEAAAKAVNKRYEGLLTVRSKAVNGKGAWYWTHLEPILVRDPETTRPKAVKLKCNLCSASFSASNPSRTATEHLKRGTCPNFGSVVRPVSQLPPLASPKSNRKRGQSGVCSSSSYAAAELTAIDSSPVAAADMVVNQHQLVLSGGKEDLGALAKLEDSVKKLKSPKSSPGQALSKEQIDSAFDSLADWFYESCGSVSFSSLDHPKFRAFLNHVGLPAVPRKFFAGAMLDSKFEQARMESEARIRDAVFFQIASDGWKNDSFRYVDDCMIKFTVILPNGSCVFHKAMYKGGSLPPQYAEDVLWETVRGISGSVVQRCVGIVGDRFKSNALKNLELKNHWMVNFSCLFQGLVSLIKDFSRDLPLFKFVTDSCFKIATLFNTIPQIRNHFRKFRSHGVELPGLIRVPSPHCNLSKNSGAVTRMLEDVLSYARILQLIVLDDSYKSVCVENHVAQEVAEMIQDVGFWNNVEAVHSLVKTIKDMAEDVEAERPLIGQCLPLWNSLRVKVKEWCVKYRIAEGPVEKVLERRFKKSYHPAWPAAFVLDPLYLMRDTSGKYLPPFKCLTNEQETDVDKLITRLVSRDEAPVALMELMKWRSEGLDPLYAQAVQVKQRDPATGRMKIANPQSSRLVWETCLKEFKSLGNVAVRLIFLHATSCAFKSNWPSMRWLCSQGNSNSRAGLDRVQKMVFLAAHAKLERQIFLSEEEKDSEVFPIASGEDSMLNEAFIDPR